VETADSLQTITFLCLMADGQLESTWSQLRYATRTLSPDRLVLKVTLFLSPPERGYTFSATVLYMGVSLFSEPPRGGTGFSY